MNREVFVPNWNPEILKELIRKHPAVFLCLLISLGFLTISGATQIPNQGQENLSSAISSISAETSFGLNLIEIETSKEPVLEVNSGDTISSIAERAYLDYNDNQSSYHGILRQANQQNPQKNLLIFPREILYIPKRGTPTYGLAVNESITLNGQEIGKKNWPIIIKSINVEKRTVDIFWINGEINDIKVGSDFATDRGIYLAAILPAMPEYNVPARVIFEVKELVKN